MTRAPRNGGRGASVSRRSRRRALHRLQPLRELGFAVRRPGTYSSTTTWKFVPPKPKALTPARRIPPSDVSHGRSAVFTANGQCAKSMVGLGCSKCRLGGSTFSCSARIALRRPAAPAAAFRCPMLDFTEPSAMRPGAAPASPNTAARLSTSTTSPTRVDVPCPSTRRRRRRRQPGVLPGALDGEALSDRIGGGDALALAVARAADAAQHGVDLVAVALGVGEALEQEDHRAFAHDEAVGAVGVGTRAGGRQRADLAELDERAGAHVAVDAAGEDGVVVALHEPFDRGADRRHGRGAGRVDDVVRSVEVEEVGDPAGDAVRQLAGHRVFGDLGKAPADTLLQLGRDGAPHLGRQRREAGAAASSAAYSGK